MESLAPVVLFVYNRPEHTQKTIDYLKKNSLTTLSELFIFCDGPKSDKVLEKTNQVRKIVKALTGFKSITIFEKETNSGLANSVISGVSKIINKYNKAIVVEDDLITSPNFLAFMNDSLNKYELQKNIFSISGYSYPIQLPKDYTSPVFLAYRGSSWGWATWKDRWNSIDWGVSDFNELVKSSALQKKFNHAGEDLYNMLLKQRSKQIDSWAIRFAYAANKQNSLHLLPVVSKVQNIGNDDSGRHSKRTNIFEVVIDTRSLSDQLPDNIEFNEPINKRIYNFMKPNILKYFKNKIISFLNTI